MGLAAETFRPMRVQALVVIAIGAVLGVPALVVKEKRNEEPATPVG